VGLFDFLRRGPKPPPEATPKDRKLAALAKTAGDRRAQSYDRDEALRGLSLHGTPDAAEALLKRFTFVVDPTITDEEEKNLAFDAIVRIGTGSARIRIDGSSHKDEHGNLLPLEPAEVAELREAVVEKVRQFCARAENLSWALRLLRALLDDEQYEAELLALLEGSDTEYVRNVEPKLNVICALEEVISDAAREAVEPYLEDVNETVRFHAVETTFKQQDPVAVPALVRMLKQEESTRVKNKVAEGLTRLGWAIPKDLRAELTEGLRDVGGYGVDAEGKVHKA
jgi:HEAT repeat protein